MNPSSSALHTGPPCSGSFQALRAMKKPFCLFLSKCFLRQLSFSSTMSNSKDITSLFGAFIFHNLKTECLQNSWVKCFQRKGTAVGVFDFYSWKKQEGRSMGSPCTQGGLEGWSAAGASGECILWEESTYWKGLISSMCSSHFYKSMLWRSSKTLFHFMLKTMYKIYWSLYAGSLRKSSHLWRYFGKICR